MVKFNRRKGVNQTAQFEFDSFDDILNDLESEPFECTCSICGKQFEATQDDLLKPTVTCPHCGAELEEV